MLDTRRTRSQEDAKGQTSRSSGDHGSSGCYFPNCLYLIFETYQFWNRRKSYSVNYEVDILPCGNFSSYPPILCIVSRQSVCDHLFAINLYLVFAEDAPVSGRWTIYGDFSADTLQ